jgi:hypothetical protein
MSRLYGGFGELPLRESVLGAARQTKDRAIAELFEEVDELREALRLIAHRTDRGEEKLMGQAKNRGTFEQRVEQAKERQEREQQAFAERMEAERKAEREAEIAARLTGDAPVTRNRGRRVPSAVLLAALALGSIPHK